MVTMFHDDRFKLLLASLDFTGWGLKAPPLLARSYSHTSVSATLAMRGFFATLRMTIAWILSGVAFQDDSQRHFGRLSDLIVYYLPNP